MSPLEAQPGPYDLRLLFETPGEPGTVLDPRAEGVACALLEEAVVVGRCRSYAPELRRHQLTVRAYVPVSGRAELEALLERWEKHAHEAGVTLASARIVQAAGWYRDAALRLFADD